MEQDPADSELMRRFASGGDAGAFDALVRRWDARVLAYLAKAAGDIETAYDLRQEVFLRVYRYGGSYDPGRPFVTWFFRIAANALHGWQARCGRRSEMPWPVNEDGERPFEPADSAPGPRQCAESAEEAARLRAVLATLAPAERELLLLRFDLQLSFREIGEVLKCPETTIKSRLSRLLERLRERLAQPAERMPVKP